MVVFISISSVVNAQLVTINSGLTPQDLIENHLVEGCVEISNAKSSINGSVDALNSFGRFERGTSSFPLEKGIVLSTGNVNRGGNSAVNTDLSDGTNGWGSDSDLENITGITNTLNATALEFNFTATTNTIAFKYLLASEEYGKDQPCESNDAFVFLIRPLGSTTYQNMATVAGGFVSTRTIHQNIPNICPGSNENFFEGENFSDMNYDGRTTILTATTSIVPGTTYEIKLVIADFYDRIYDSAVFIETSVFDTPLNLGADITKCATNVNLNGTINYANTTYQWLFNNVEISGATLPLLNVTQSGTYTLKAELTLQNEKCLKEDSIEVTLNNIQNANPISNFEICANPVSGGTVTFELANKDNDVRNSVPSSTYNIRYYNTSEEAEVGDPSNAITSVESNGITQTIYVRIEDVNTGCLAFNSFNLVVLPIPAINTPTLLEVCQNPLNNIRTSVNLAVKNNEISNGATNVAITYHTTLSGAQNGNALINNNTYNALVGTSTVYVRLRNLTTGCINTTTLNIQVNPAPIINRAPLIIDACDIDNDGFATFDLTSIIPDVLNGMTTVNPTFFRTLADATSNNAAIPNPNSFTNTVAFEQTVFIRVRSEATGCSAVRSFTLITNVLASEINTKDITVCNSISGIETFDLNQLANTISNGLADVTITFFETLENREDEIDALDINIPFETNQPTTTLYLKIEKDGCVFVDEINLIIQPATTFPSIGRITVCDTNDNGIMPLNLSSYNSRVTNNTPGFTVRYFLTESDANANTTALPNNYQNNTPITKIWTRISSTATSCFTVNSFEIEVNPAPTTTTPSPILVCDDDQDGISIINLESVIPQMVISTTDLNISFHTTLQNARNKIEITNPSAYSTGTRTIYIRVENDITKCFFVETLAITVNTLPVFEDITPYVICIDSGNTADFILNTKDTEILAGQTGKRVLYYDTALAANDGIAGTEINKSSPYTNTENPQEIFVRVENNSDPSCFEVASFFIEVEENAPFNQPTNLTACDDITNNEREIFDFTATINEITNGIGVTLDVQFFETLEDAQNNDGSLPTQYTNKTNPQIIYTRIDDGSLCPIITTFELTVLRVGQFSTTEFTIESCDTDYDGEIEFDLTQAEAEAIIRPFNIVTEYYSTLDDVNTANNAIPNPENYTNIGNNTVVYLKIINTVSNCFVALPINLKVNLPPTINDFKVYEICDNPAKTFNPELVNEALVNDTDNKSFSYFTSLEKAQSNEDRIIGLYNYVSSNQELFARVTNTITRCFIIYPFTLQVNPLPEINKPNNLEACDDNFDGLLFFDLSTQTSIILGTLDPAKFDLSYHNSLENAKSGQSPLNTNYEAQNLDSIYARVLNTETGCFSITDFQIIIHPLPVVEIPNQVICLDSLPLLVSANTNNPNDTYLWSTGTTTPEIAITTQGTYSVTVTSEFGCTTFVTFNAIESEQATIESIETTSFSNPNTITVTASGIGDYRYVLDDGEPQSSNVFENVRIGYHTVTVIDLNGCTPASRQVVVVDAPKFFTPNNDGFFDTWHIAGAASRPGTIVEIFNRYGKLLKVLTYDAVGWDGTVNSNLAPTDDYWYKAKIVDGDDTYEVRGHFTLKR